MINNFKAFNIVSIPRVRNSIADALANATTRMSSLKIGFSVEIIYKPSVPNNVPNLCIFNDDQQILHFMADADIFKDDAIKKDEHDQAL